MRPSWMKKPIMSAAMPAGGASGMGSGGIYTGSQGSAGTKTPLPRRHGRRWRRALLSGGAAAGGCPRAARPHERYGGAGGEGGCRRL